MARVKILRDGAIADPSDPRAPVVHGVEGDVVELSNAAAKMAVEESDPPRAEYVDEDDADERESEEKSEDEEREQKHKEKQPEPEKHGGLRELLGRKEETKGGAGDEGEGSSSPLD